MIQPQNITEVVQEFVLLLRLDPAAIVTLKQIDQGVVNVHGYNILYFCACNVCVCTCVCVCVHLHVCVIQDALLYLLWCFCYYRYSFTS